MKKLLLPTLISLSVLLSFGQPAYDFSKLQREKLGRGLVAFRSSETEVTLSWRYLSSDPISTSFNVYRDGEKIAEVPARTGTFFKDNISSAESGAEYTVKAVVGGKESAEIQGHFSLPANAPVGYINIPLDRPEDGVTPAGQQYFYAPNDASVGDVDGDGEYEIILKWEPSNAHDNAHDGYTGNVLFDCYRLSGEKLWRIDMGRNIRAGAHYTQFLVFDFDGDGKAEMVAKTSDGTIDGCGKVIGDATADYREKNGRIYTGPEFLTIFNGETGAAMQTIDYVPRRGRIEDWGDNRANRSDRYLAAVAYLDGKRPSAVMCRGYYTRATLVAFDWDGRELKQRWMFDSNAPGCEGYAGQGNHNLRVGDVDGDGCDEIIYGSCAIDHDGRGLYTTGMGHGDAMHMMQFSPDMPGLQVWDCHENHRDGSSFRNAATGEVLFQVRSGDDVGRCMAADIDPTNPGVEMWSISPGAMYNIKGEKLRNLPRRFPINMAVWWDGDLLREMLNYNVVSKFNWQTGVCDQIEKFDGAMSINGTKATPCLQADILGDWREEILLRSTDNTSLRLYISPIPTDYRFHTFLEDPVYRISVATENVCYNQPTQPGFYFGPDLKSGTFRGWEFSNAEVVWFERGAQVVSYSMQKNHDAVVDVALSLFTSDIEAVTGTKAVAKSDGIINIVQLDKAMPTEISRLKELGIDTERLQRETDAFVVKAVGEKIFVVGGNGRGTAYGLLELSREAGVSPWVWWGDCVPSRKEKLSLPSDYENFQSASVEMRGIFINDEDWSLRPWGSEKIDGKKFRIKPETYRRVFELLLRLRANAIWPAMHEGTEAFFKNPLNKAMADSCGIFVGTSHCEPLLRNNVDEWNREERGDFNYITNKENVQNYWTERLEEVKKSKTNIFTIGMRGIHDGSMEGVKTTQEKFDALQQVIDDQQELLRKHIGEPSRLPQVFVPYKEVLELYEKGLKVPEYVTLMWCDDNYGYMTRLSNAEEQKRSGGGGVYYHLSYWGRPHDYLWLTTTQPGLIYNEMKAAYDHNVRKLWIVNVHDPKVAGYDLELFLDMAWNINCVSAATVGEHYKAWLCRQFGAEVGEKIYPAMREFYRLTGLRKPEFMGWNQVELDKKKYNRGISPIVGTEFTETAFGNELQSYLDSYEAITMTAAEAFLHNRPEMMDAYYAAIFYPVCAAAAQASKVLEAQRGDTIASRDAYQKILEITERYGMLSGGKWKGLMDMAPRMLPVFDDPKNFEISSIAASLSPQARDCSAVPCASVAGQDFISRPASSFKTKGEHCDVIDLLGHSLSAVSIPKGESLTFDFSTENESKAVLKTALIPTQPNDGGDIRYSVSIDGGEEIVYSLKEPFRSERWKLNVLRGQAVRETGIFLSKGMHSFVIKALDDHIVLDQWMIDFNTSRKHYLFPRFE